MKKFVLVLSIICLMFLFYSCDLTYVTGTVIDKYIEPPAKNNSLKHIIVVKEKEKVYFVWSAEIYYNIDLGDILEFSYGTPIASGSGFKYYRPISYHIEKKINTND